MLLSHTSVAQDLLSIAETAPVGTAGGDNKWMYYAAPILTLFVCGLGAAVLFRFQKTNAKRLLDFSRSIRYLFSAFYVILIPLVVCAWSDLIDVSEILSGKITGLDSFQLSLIAVLLVCYLFCHGLALHHEEVLADERETAEFDFKGVECQRGFLVNFLECLRKAIGKHVEILTEIRTAGIKSVPQFSERHTKGVIQFLLEVVRSTYRTLPTVPADAKVFLVLFHEVGEYLEPYASFNGMQFDYFNVHYQQCREHFCLKHHMSSSAVNAALSQTVDVVENTVEANGDPLNPFSFIPTQPRQREEVGSLICLPFTTHSPEKRWVLCVTCSTPGGFLEEHTWKSRHLRDEIEIRVNLILEAANICEGLAKDAETREKEMVTLQRKIDTFEGKATAKSAGSRQDNAEPGHPRAVDKPLYEKVFGHGVDVNNADERRVV